MDSKNVLLNDQQNEQQIGAKMKKNIPSLQKCRLFAGMSPADLEILLGCLQPRQKSFYKNNYILTTEESPNMAGIVLSGAVHIVSDDEHDGRRRIIERIENGGMFAADFCHAHHEELTVSAIAAEKTEVLFVDYRRILDACSSACTFHTKLLKNFVILQAKQKVALLKKLEHITQSTTRKKLLSYLKEEARLFEKKPRRARPLFVGGTQRAIGGSFQDA
jgi:CRP-like cAMP-binding protein